MRRVRRRFRCGGWRLLFATRRDRSRMVLVVIQRKTQAVGVAAVPPDLEIASLHFGSPVPLHSSESGCHERHCVKHETATGPQGRSQSPSRPGAGSGGTCRS
jgi:hypothetical protein